MGPFPRAKGDLWYLLVSIDYMTKLVEAKAMSTINQQGIDKRLKNRKSKWPEELPSVVWSYRTSPRTSTGETPFKLDYGIEAILPIEVGSPSHRAIIFDEKGNKEELITNMELINEVRDQVVEKMEKYKQKTREHFSKKSRVKNFQVGDLVLRDTQASDPTNTGKIIPKWEGHTRSKKS
ncbi:uncharacterized protein LOC141673312 [Apium graveolens]|uniref:uncharacterized protein LOC141673312 n=1 Tax=Apium graveolens TaxID=4045 RepID=UPI003D7B4985